MTSEFCNFASRLREFIWSTSVEGRAARCRESRANTGNVEDSRGLSVRNPLSEHQFTRLALELFPLQFEHNVPYRRFCQARGASPEAVSSWPEIPAIPTSAFKDLELSCLPPEARTAVFHSSGTTEQRPSRHFHSPDSLAVYEASLLPWFKLHALPAADWLRASGRGKLEAAAQDVRAPMVILAPSPENAPHSSLAYMFETVRRELGADDSEFIGKPDGLGTWTIDFERALGALTQAQAVVRPVVLLGTAFSFVHLLDHLVAQKLTLKLPAGSRAMETGGYKGRSRSLSKAELHALIAQHLGISPTHTVCEYGMSELSSQAYDGAVRSPKSEVRSPKSELESPERVFQFPPWARAQVVSPETGRAVAEGETGLLRIFDLANVFSVMAIQTEDLGVRRGNGFELIGRAELAELRGCSLMAV